MTRGPESEISELDAVLDRTGVSAELADELFAVVDLLDGSPALRRALTDPSTPSEGRQDLAARLLRSRISDSAFGVVAEVVGRRNAGRGLPDALERQAIRAVLKTAENDGRLDDVEDQLFRFARLVERNAELRPFITDRSAPVERRQHLVDGLLQSKAQPQTIRLVKRALKARDRTFQRTLAGYVSMAAAMRGRTIATVRVARPLEESQRQRLQAVLARQLGHEVALQEIVEPQLLGGVRVEFGDEVIEGTVAARLNEARRQFSRSAS